MPLLANIHARGYAKERPKKGSTPGSPTSAGSFDDGFGKPSGIEARFQFINLLRTLKGYFMRILGWPAWTGIVRDARQPLSEILVNSDINHQTL